MSWELSLLPTSARTLADDPRAMYAEQVPETVCAAISERLRATGWTEDPDGEFTRTLDDGATIQAIVRAGAVGVGVGYQDAFEEAAESAIDEFSALAAEHELLVWDPQTGAFVEGFA